jgi:hypothetical protein
LPASFRGTLVGAKTSVEPVGRPRRAVLDKRAVLKQRLAYEAFYGGRDEHAKHDPSALPALTLLMKT